MAGVKLLVGTKKGLFIFSSNDRVAWSLDGPFQPGREINHAVYDPRNQMIFATANDAWFGCELVASNDFGKNWTTATVPPQFSAESGQKIERLWHIEPGPKSQPDVLYAGVAPAALFRSEDRGQTWTLLESLSNHPTRDKWNPGAGGLCLHSIVMDHQNDDRIFAGISAAGVFRSDDRGKSWRTANRGTRAEFLPDKYPEVGQCVHKLLSSPANPGTLFQQNHCGVYRSNDLGDTWTEITKGLPSDFGFPLAVHPFVKNTIFVLPMKGAEFRCPPDGKLQVHRSRDGGEHWEAMGKGLPDHDAFTGVYREGMTMDQSSAPGLYFGTNTGKVFGSIDEGESWNLVADNLPPVYSVSAATLQ
jgi:hypothetical protein